MKTRKGFVSNSSSTSFMITNKTKERKTLVDLVNENLHWLEKFNDDYDYEYIPEQLLKIAKEKPIVFLPLKTVECEFGDHDGPYADTPLGHTLMFMSRYAKSGTISFQWQLKKD
jgi:hypothetical protein